MAKFTLKILSVSCNFESTLEGFRSFNVKNLGSVSYTASKLSAVKVGGLKKKSAIRPRPQSNHLAQVRVVLGSNHSQSLMAGNFVALLTYRPQIFNIKRSKPFVKVYQKSMGQQHFKGGFCPLKMTSFSQGLLSNRM